MPEQLANWSVAMRERGGMVRCYWVPVGYTDADLNDSNMVACMPLDVLRDQNFADAWTLMVQFMSLELAHVRLGIPRNRLGTPHVMTPPTHPPGHS